MEKNPLFSFAGFFITQTKNHLIIILMKHCLNCYKMIPNDAEICHYCGERQAVKESPIGKKILRCPRCMSFLYDEAHGCGYCGYMPNQAKGLSKGNIIFSLTILLFLFFILWQLGLFPAIPYNGKLVSLIVSTSVAPVYEPTPDPALASKDSDQNPEEIFIRNPSDYATTEEAFINETPTIVPTEAPTATIAAVQSTESWITQDMIDFIRATLQNELDPTIEPEIDGADYQEVYNVLESVIKEMYVNDQRFQTAFANEKKDTNGAPETFTTIDPQQFAKLKAIIEVIFQTKFPNFSPPAADNEERDYPARRSALQLTESGYQEFLNAVKLVVVRMLQNNKLTISYNKVPDSKLFVCKNQASRFTRGMQGSILRGGKSSKIREKPSTSAPSISILLQSHTFTVLSNQPVCADGYMWIQIKVEGVGIIGWTVEGTGESYWLVPHTVQNNTLETPEDDPAQ